MKIFLLIMTACTGLFIYTACKPVDVPSECGDSELCIFSLDTGDVLFKY